MVATEIPKHYTASPSSHIGTPHLTINKEATENLDSSSAFEGKHDGGHIVCPRLTGDRS
jgi:S-adenosylmethionine decarboxylase